MPVLLDTPHYLMEHLDNGIVHVVVRGDFSNAIIDEFERASDEHMKRLAPVLYMNDASQAGDGPLSSKWHLAALMKKRAPLVKRSAIYGMFGTRRLIVGALLRASGRADRVGMFDTREEAERYLLSST